MGKEKYNKEELIRLLIHEGKSYKEVGELLHISANTVKISRSGL